MTGAEMIVQVLADEGVSTIFGYSGGAILPTYDAVFCFNDTLALGAMRRPAAAALTLVAAVIAVDWTAVVRVLPEFERYKPVPAFSRELQDRLAPGDVVAHYQVALPSMVFYLRRHVEQSFEAAKFVAAVTSGKTVYAVLSADDYNSLAPEIGARTCIIDRRPTFEVKLRQVLKRQPLPELLLISNRCR